MRISQFVSALAVGTADDARLAIDGSDAGDTGSGTDRSGLLGVAGDQVLVNDCPVLRVGRLVDPLE